MRDPQNLFHFFCVFPLESRTGLADINRRHRALAQLIFEDDFDSAFESVKKWVSSHDNPEFGRLKSSFAWLLASSF